MRRYLDEDVDEVLRRLGPAADALRGRTVLLAGAAGFIGTHLLAVFDRMNRAPGPKVQVLALDNMISSQCLPEHVQGFEGVEFRVQDVIRPLDLDQRADFVIHAAGIASPVWYKTNPLETLDVSVMGTRNLLDYARKHGARMLYLSSSEIYGDPDPRHVPTSENYAGHVACTGPRACYDEGKRVAETLCDIYHGTFGVQTVVVRPFNVFGPGLSERDFRVLPNFARRVKSGLPLRVYGTGNQTRTFCYIADALVGFLLALVRGTTGETYNIGNPKPEISMAELARTVRRVLGDRVTHEIVDYPDGYPSNEPNRRCPDIAKAQLHFGYQPAVALEDGLARFFRWTDSVYVGDDHAPGTLHLDPAQGRRA